jgi:hypothetical protein
VDWFGDFGGVSISPSASCALTTGTGVARALNLVRGDAGAIGLGFENTIQGSFGAPYIAVYS